jgi:hypothetical protein
LKPLLNTFATFFYMHKEKKDDIDNNKGQYTDQYSIGKERDDYFVPAIFETVNQDRPRWKRQRKKIVSDSKSKKPDNDNVHDADNKSIFDDFFGHTKSVE